MTTSSAPPIGRRRVRGARERQPVRRPVPPRGRCTRRTGSEILKNFLYEVADAAPAWTPSTVIGAGRAESGRRLDEHHVCAGLSGGVNSAVRGAARLQGGRRAAQRHYLSSTTASSAPARPAGRQRISATTSTSRSSTFRRQERSSRRSTSISDPEEGGKRSAPSSSASSRTRRRQPGRPPFPQFRVRFYSQRDRVRRHQRTPSRSSHTSRRGGRPPGGMALTGARGAAGAAVQGRGAGTWRSELGVPEGCSGGSRSRGRARDSDHRRGDARAARHPPRGRRDPPGRGAPRRASTASCGRFAVLPAIRSVASRGTAAHVRVPHRSSGR